jgi:hypothetical protein
LDLGINYTRGEISQVPKDDYGKPIIIRHNSDIAPGNSGGALYRGNEVIGVNVSMIAGAYINQAVPINFVKTILDNLEPDKIYPLSYAFPQTPEELIKISQQISAVNFQVPPPASGEKAGVYSLSATLNPLEDYVIALDSPGKDLSFMVVKYDQSGQEKLIGLAATQGSEMEILFLSSEYRQEIAILILNPYKSAVNAGLSLNKINF